METGILVTLGSAPQWHEAAAAVPESDIGGRVDSQHNVPPEALRAQIDWMRPLAAPMASPHSARWARRRPDRANSISDKWSVVSRAGGTFLGPPSVSGPKISGPKCFLAAAASDAAGWEWKLERPPERGGQSGLAEAQCTRARAPTTKRARI